MGATRAPFFGGVTGWLSSAMRLLTGGAVVSAGAGAIEAATGIDVPFLGSRGGVVGADGRLRRRRRRRALTQSDRDDIAFIAATLGDTTGRKFALVLASRMGR